MDNLPAPAPQPDRCAAAPEPSLLLVGEPGLRRSCLSHYFATVGQMRLAGVGPASDALRAAAATPVDVVVMILMREDTGVLGILEALRQLLPTMPIVVLADDSGALPLMAIQRGARGCLSLTMPMREIVRAVHSAARGDSLITRDRLSTFIRPRHTARPQQHAPCPVQLTQREREVLQRIVEGLSTAEMALALQISTVTVRTHIQSVLLKLGCHSRLEAAAYAVRHGIPGGVTMDDAQSELRRAR